MTCVLNIETHFSCIRIFLDVGGFWGRFSNLTASALASCLLGSGSSKVIDSLGGRGGTVSLSVLLSGK